jgi:predicted aspartyl protease
MSPRVLPIAVGFAALLLSGGAFAQECGLKQIASLDMQVTANNRILIPVSIGNAPRLAMIDTGAMVGLLDLKAADELGIERRATARTHWEFFFANGEKASEFALVPSLKIGFQEVTNTDFLIKEFKGPFPSGFAGTIGDDILKNFDIDFDFAAGKFNLFSPDHCPGKVVYWAKAYTDIDARIDRYGNIAVTMSLDGHDVDAIVDTGSPMTILNATDAKASFGIEATSPGAEALTNDVPGTFRYRFKSLTLGGIEMPNPMIVVMPDAFADASRRELRDEKLQGYQGNDSGHGPTLILGADALRHLHVYIAYGERKIYATAAGAH